MAALKVTFTAAAVPSGCRPSLPRSGACAAPLPAWHAHEVIMLGGYTEDRGDRPGARPAAPAAPAKEPTPPPPPPPPPPPHRAPTIEAWTFSSEAGGRWHPIAYAEGTPVPQPRLACQAAVVGDELWVVGGWDPSAAPDSQFLNDVWALDLRTYRWRRVEVEGEEVPRISRFALTPLPDGRLLLHTHRCDDHVLLLDPRVTAEAAGEAAEPAASTARPALRKIAVHSASPAGAGSPPSRGLHSLTLAAPPPLPNGKTDGRGSTTLYMYGGAPQSGPMYGDLWVLDTGAMTWRQLTPEGPTPQARCSHVAGACVGGGGGVAGRYLLVAGGSYYVQPGQLQPLDDVMLYDTQTNRWMEPEVEGAGPSPRNAAIMAPLRNGADGGGGVGERFVLHGGWRPFVETYDDTYIVTVTPADGR